jgi:outer membrane protein insertion porin family
MIKLIVNLYFLFNIGIVYGFEIKHVDFSCTSRTSCHELEDAFKSLSRKYIDVTHFKNLVKIYIANNGIKKISYEVKKINSSNHLYIKASQRERILFVDDAHFSGEYVIEIPTILPIKKNDYFDLKKNQSTIDLISEIARERGFPYAKVTVSTRHNKKGVSLYTKINLGRPVLVDDISLLSKSKYIKKIMNKRFRLFKDNPFDLQQIKAEIEKTKKLLIQYGYYLSNISIKYKRSGDDRVIVYIEIKDVRNYTFYFDENLFFPVDNLKKTMSSAFVGYRRELDINGATQVIKEHYEKYGFLQSSIDVKKHAVVDSNGEDAILYKFRIAEKKRKKISEILIQGNDFFDSQEIIESYYLSAPSQTLENYYDLNYYEQFVEYLKEKYIAAGFVSVFVDRPDVRETDGESSVLFRVKEGLRTDINKLEIIGIPVTAKFEILELIENKEHKHFNPIAFQSDLQIITKYLHNKGYYFAEISNIQDTDLVSYNDDNTAVDIKIDLNTGLKLYTNEIIIIGNTKTRKILINREISIAKGDLLTNKKIEESQTNLLSLGLFSSVQIKPVSQTATKTDVLIFVREKDFGVIELAPGVRSDLGFKMSAAINYNNIDGMNKRISFKGTINKRFELGSLDTRRRSESSSLAEYDTIAKFAEDHIFYSDIDFTTTLSKSRKRFYAFDADIQKVAFGISEDFTSWFSMGLRYQLETISQFDATVEKEHGHFKIGSFTPSMTFDFRDNAINSTKGALFSFSCEFANPNFGSQDNSETVIDYYKLVNRNRFYIPLSDRATFAISTAYGIQENKSTDIGSDGSTEGQIPGIKVFRLTGADIVRGYEDSEINRLISKEDISEVDVGNRAYMVNIKLEPRFYLSDSTMLGVFYDAGRVFVDEFDSSQLRSSVGLSFKYLTPVGSLDFDYGIKLLREENDRGTLDSPGRLHVSIGFF